MFAVVCKRIYDDLYKIFIHALIISFSLLPEALQNNVNIMKKPFVLHRHVNIFE